MVFNIEDYRDGRYMMLCSNAEERVFFKQYLDSLGLTWCNGQSYVDPEYAEEEYDDNTYYLFNEGRYGNIDNVSEAVCEKYLLYFSDFEWEKTNFELDISSEAKEAFDNFLLGFKKAGVNI